MADAKTRLLVVDDSATARATLRSVIEELDLDVDEVIEAPGGEQAVEVVRRESCGLTMVLMDLMMPGIDGVEATRRLREECPELPVVIFSSSLDADDVQRALEAGASGYTVKSSDPIELRLAVSAAIRGRGVLSPEIVRPVLSHYVQLLEGTRKRHRAVIESLAAAVEAKDVVTSRHLHRVTALAISLARRIDPEMAERDDYVFGCMLHDVGKIGIPEEILGKAAALDDTEWEVMREHPRIGVHVIKPLELGPLTTEIVLHHHERWDGSGYPDALAGEQIPLCARIFAVCDALDAMVSDRPYRAGMSAEEAISAIDQAAGSQFDPQVVEQLVAAFDDGQLEM